MTTPELAVRLVISSALPDLVIDGENSELYELHPDTAASQQVSWRKQEAANEWVEGTFVTSAVRENITETLSIWVYGNNQDEYALREWELLRRLHQLKYTVALTLGGVTQTWKCFLAETDARSEHAFRHASIGLVEAKVPRLPRKVVTGTFGSVNA